jgi:hypothetical protein
VSLPFSSTPISCLPGSMSSPVREAAGHPLSCVFTCPPADSIADKSTNCSVGKLLVAALSTPFAPVPSPQNNAENIRCLYVSSFTSTPNAVVAEFERQTGGKWSVEYTDLDVLRKEEKQAYERDAGNKTAYTLRRIWAEGGTLYEGTGGAGAAKVGMGGEVGLEGLESVVGRVVKKQTG